MVDAYLRRIEAINPALNSVVQVRAWPMRRWRGASASACYVEDLSLALPIIAGTDWRNATAAAAPLAGDQAVELASLLVAFFTDNGIVAPTSETAAAVCQAARALAAAAAVVEETRPAGVEQSFDLMARVFASAGSGGLQGLIQLTGTTEFSPLILQFAALLLPYVPKTAADLGDLLARWDVWRNGMLAFLERYDLLLSPVTATPALPHGTTLNGDNPASLSYAMTHSLTGWPCVVLRGGTSPEGLPIGVQVVARPWHEDVALAAALQIEQALVGWQCPPAFTSNPWCSGIWNIVRPPGGRGWLPEPPITGRAAALHLSLVVYAGDGMVLTQRRGADGAARKRCLAAGASSRLLLHVLTASGRTQSEPAG